MLKSSSFIFKTSASVLGFESNNDLAINFLCLVSFDNFLISAIDTAASISLELSNFFDSAFHSLNVFAVNILGSLTASIIKFPSSPKISKK